MRCLDHIPKAGKEKTCTKQFRFTRTSYISKLGQHNKLAETKLIHKLNKIFLIGAKLQILFKKFRIKEKYQN